MKKQDLKSLLENIYHLLAEDAPPPPTAEEPRGTVRPGYAPGMSPQERTSFYDRNGPPPMPWWGPWSPGPDGVGVWSDTFHHWEPFWPPPTGLVPDGPGGMWMRASNPTCPQCGFQYWYVYPQPNGQFWMHQYWLHFPGQFGERRIMGGGWT